MRPKPPKGESLIFKNQTRGGLPKLYLLGGLWLGLWGGASAALAGRHEVLSPSRKAYAPAPRIGDVALDETLTATIGLTLQNPEALLTLIESQYDRNSPSYRHFLSPSEFANQFSPGNADYQKVMDFSQANHLSVVATSSNRLIVTVQGTVASLQSVFGVTLGRYRRADGSEFRGLDREPSLDLEVPVTQISGLDNFKRPRSNLLRSTLRSKNAVRPGILSFGSGTGYEGSYQGYDFRDAYLNGVAASLTGAGQTIGLVEFTTYPTLASDIQNYEQTSSPPLPMNSPTQVTFSASTFDSTGLLVNEASLDIETAIAMAPGATIVVYEGSQFGDGTEILNAMATDLPLCRQISCSFSFGDANASTLLTELAAQGQGVFIASGDNGAYGSGDMDGPVPYPMSLSPFLTVVGGTALTTSGSPTQTFGSETAWNDYCTSCPDGGSGEGGASGGGICSDKVNQQSQPAQLALPFYQNGVANGSNQASSTWRNIPDVAMNATNFLVVSEGTTYPSSSQQSDFEGTSGAAPLWAAFSALVNEQAAAQGVAPLGFANPALYGVGGSSGGSSAFHDTTSGDNSMQNANPIFYNAVGGYDLVTGWGSPNGLAMVQALVGEITVVGTSGFAPPSVHFVTYPNPFSPRHNGVMALRFGASANALSLDVFDSAYREMNSVNLNPAQSGMGSGQYNVCDGNGRILAPGTYYAVLKGAGSPQTCKFTVTP